MERTLYRLFKWNCIKTDGHRYNVFIEPFLPYFLTSLRVMIFTIKSPHLSWLKAVPRLVKFTVLDGKPFCATVIPVLMQSWSLADSTSVWRWSSNPFYRILDLHNIRSTSKILTYLMDNFMFDPIKKHVIFYYFYDISRR